MSNGVLAFAETADSGLKKSAWEVVGAGARLAEELGSSFSAVIVGEDTTDRAAELGRCGVPRIYTVEDPALARYTSDGYSAALAAAVERAEAEIILLPATAMGKDLGPALAARISAGIITDAVEVSAPDGGLVAVRPVYAGKTRITVAPAAAPVVVSLRPNVFEPAAEGEGEAEVIALAPGFGDGAIRTVVKDVLAPEVRKVDLTEADIIVSGGRGMKGPEHFHLVEELAEALGGVVGASRAVVDAGWRPHSEQVGQTGKTVSPKLYVALGISGAIQHLAGMSSSRCIVAVNKDPEAPIFQVADYGIVGDVFDVVPALIAAVKEKVSS